MITIHPARGAGLTDLITTMRCLAQVHLPDQDWLGLIRTGNGGLQVPDELARIYLNQQLGPGPATQPQPATPALAAMSRTRELGAGLTPRAKKRTTTTEDRS